MTGNCGILRARGAPRAEALRQDPITGVAGQQSFCEAHPRANVMFSRGGQGWRTWVNLIPMTYEILERENLRIFWGKNFARVWISEVITVVVINYHNLNLWYKFDIFTCELVIYNGSIFRHEITGYVNMISMAFSITALISHQSKLHTKAGNTSPLSSNEELEVTHWLQPCSAKPASLKHWSVGFCKTLCYVIKGDNLKPKNYKKMCLFTRKWCTLWMFTVSY